MSARIGLRDIVNTTAGGTGSDAIFFLFFRLECGFSLGIGRLGCRGCSLGFRRRSRSLRGSGLGFNLRRGVRGGQRLRFCPRFRFRFSSRFRDGSGSGFGTRSGLSLDSLLRFGHRFSLRFDKCPSRGVGPGLGFSPRLRFDRSS